MNQLRNGFWLFCGLCWFLAAPVHATVISYDVTSVGGSTWEYSYTVENDSLGFDLEEFAIYFDVGLYENLVATSTPAGWDPLVLQPDPFLPDDGIYDALALFVPGIAPGATLAGFSVQFDFLVAGTPGAQFFEIVDPFTFDVLDSGVTRLAGAAPVPEPGLLWLVGIGLLWFGVMGRKGELLKVSRNYRVS